MSHRLGVRGIGKCFRAVAALSDVDLDVGAGEIVAVVGENGAGKSTLLKIVAGLLQPDSGALEWEGSKVRFSGPRDALARGIVLIHQELELASNLDVAANISLGREQRRFGCIDHHGVTRDARRWLDAVGAEFPPETPVANLTTGNQQLVEIAKALSREASLLVMDEPTSSLSASETARLLRLVQDLADRGLAVLYVSHRLAEVQTLADRVVVLRDGRVSGRLTGEGISRDRIVRAMVGRDLARSERAPREVGDIALSVCGLRTQRFPEARVSFDVRRGEILGLAGLVGAGRTELLSAIFGLERPLAGTMTVFGQAYTPAHPRAALNAGIGLVPEDRKLAALFLELAVSFNASIAVLKRTTRWGLSSARREQALMRPLLERVQLAGGCGDPPIAGLSGGNQQKVILARWLALEPRILLLDEPTRGIDVGARQQIYDLVLRLAAEGLAVVLASSEMEEVLTLPDRVLVLRDGRITGELWDESRTEEAIMSLATAESP